MFARRDHGHPVTRRRFLARSSAALAAAIAGGFAALGLPPLVAPAFRTEEGGWSPIGKLGVPAPGGPDLETPGTVVATSFTRVVKDGYLPPRPQETMVFVANRGGSRFTVFDGRCTHLGCPVSWDEMTREFYCPCHGAVFVAGGNVVDGPPPRPLDRYEWRVQDGVLYAGPLEQSSNGT
jgi:Rieske Fe-S protein